MEHFYLITNETKDPDFEITYRIRDYLLKCGKKCSIREKVREKRGKVYTDSNMLKEDVDCVLVLGGDGTLLQAAADLADLSVPFLGINLGTLGFLAEVNKDDMEEAFSKLLAGEYEIENRMMLYGCCYRPGEDGEMDNARALNDIVISRSGSLQIIKFSIYVNGQFLNQYNADGMIVTTPTGSTGYNLSAGGPLVEPGARLIMLTPICPHSLNQRSIILSPEDVIEIPIPKRSAGGIQTVERQQTVEANFDGCHVIPLKTGERIRIVRSEKITEFIKLNQVSFLEVLHKKMQE